MSAQRPHDIGIPSGARSDLMKRELSPARQRLLTEIQKLGFGRIKMLQVRDGEPVFDPPPRVIRTIKLGGRNTPRPQIESDDFALRKRWVGFFDHFERMKNGTIAVIEITNSLPFSFQIEQTLSA
jgi:hypothetical protein